METLTNPVKRAVALSLLAKFECRCGKTFTGGSDAEVLGEPSAVTYCMDHPDERYGLIVVRLGSR